jgi:hypothetical protein
MKTIRPSILVAAAVLSLLVVQAQIPILNSYPSAKATVYLDFDGQYVEGTVWNWKGPINANPAGLTTSAMEEIFRRIADDYLPFNLNITTDSTVFNKSPVQQRIRIIFTTSSSWLGNNGGASLVGSFTWGDDTPAWVFNNALGNNSKYVATAASHEIGHTLGLQHQSLYDSGCHKISEYNGGEGIGEEGWAPIMGVGYYKKSTRWITGTNTSGCNTLQNDLAIIADSINNFGFRDEKYSAPLSINEFRLNGFSDKNMTTLYWELQSSDTIENFTIEYSQDGIHFQQLAAVDPYTYHFSLYGKETAESSYRVLAMPANQKTGYSSNIILLRSQDHEKPVLLRDNLVRDVLTVYSKGNYNYQLLDVSGRVLVKGTLHPGINSLSVGNAVKGLLLLHWEDGGVQGTEKLIKQ